MNILPCKMCKENSALAIGNIKNSPIEIICVKCAKSILVCCLLDHLHGNDITDLEAAIDKAINKAKVSENEKDRV